MREIKFGNETLENFRCHEELEFSYQPNRFVTVVGSNGSGKTSIFSGLVWACYDDTIEGLSGDSIVRKRTGKDTCVKVQWKDGNDEYEVQAYRKHSKYKNKRFLLRNGKDISGNTEKETLKKIEELLMPKDIFLNCLLFSQYVKNHFIDMSHGGQKDLLDNMLLLNRFDDYCEGTKNVIKRTDKQKEEIDYDINKIQIIIDECHESSTTTREEYKIEVKRHEDKIKELKDSNKEKEKEIKELNTQVNDMQKVQDDYDKKKKEIDDLNNKKETLKERTESKMENLRSKYSAEKSEKTSEIKEKYQGDLSTIDNDVKKVNKEISEVKDNLYKTKEVINKKATEARARDTQKREEKMTDVLSKISDKQQTISSKNDKKENTISEKEKLESKRNELNSLLNSDNPVCTQCGQELRDKKAENHIKKHLKEHSDNIDTISKSLEKLNKEIKKLEDELKELNEEKDKIVTEFNNLDTDRERKIEAKEEELTSDFNKKINKLQSQIDEKEKEKEKIEEKCEKEIENKVKELDEYYKDLAADIKKEYSQTVSSIDEDKKQKEEKLNEVETQLEELKSKNDKLTDLKNQIENNTSIINTMNENIDHYRKNVEDKLKKNRTRVEEKEMEKIQLSRQLKELEKKKQIAEFWRKAFGDTGIKSILLDESVPILNEKAKELCEYFPKIKVRFNSQTALKSGEYRNKFSVDVLQTTNLSELKELSSGERRMADIIILLCLRHLLEQSYNAKMNILLLDEILDSLDPENASIAVSMVKQLSKDHCVVLISHTLRDFIEADETLTM